MKGRCPGWRIVPARGNSKGKGLKMAWARGSMYRRRQRVPRVLELETVEEDEVMKVMRGISVSKCRSLRAFCRGK